MKIAKLSLALIMCLVIARSALYAADFQTTTPKGKQFGQTTWAYVSGTNWYDLLLAMPHSL